VIKSFKDRATRAFWEGERIREFEAFQKIALRKLDMLHAASALNDLRAPPANHLEALKADRKGQHSIRINQRWRVCFVWTDEGPAEIEIVDYH
jgi:proteic killer suppression protein